MDNVTHTLLGVTLARAFFKGATPHATLLLVLASNIPDIDVLSIGAGQLAELEIHRGYTHTFLALPLLALVCVGLSAMIGTEKTEVLKAWAIACVGVGAHLLLDWTNSFGIRPLLPFSSRWFYLDLNGLYDGVILTALGLALVWPWFVGLVASEIGRTEKRKGQGSASVVLLFLLLFEGARWSMHQRALNELSSRLYDQEVPVHVAVLPDPDNLLKWTGIVETQNAFRIVPTGLLDLTNSSDDRIFFKPPQNLTYRTAMTSESFRYMAYFGRFPVWGIEPLAIGGGVGRKVDLTDLRFGVPGGGMFHALALIDGKGQLMTSRFTFETDNSK